ncbi:MAG: hypothetical protein H6739_11535 [Alphaproteobacteria bacterium]|nr:hypothetical protein [Alphaproteobacteria bacterium]
MAIPSKGWRPIRVDGVDYRWLCRRRAPGTLRLRVQRAPCERCLLTEDFLPARRSRGDLHPLPVGPREVAEAVRAGLAAGWDPAKHTPEFLLHSASLPGWSNGHWTWLWTTWLRDALLDIEHLLEQPVRLHGWHWGISEDGAYSLALDATLAWDGLCPPGPDAPVVGALALDVSQDAADDLQFLSLYPLHPGAALPDEARWAAAGWNLLDQREAVADAGWSDPRYADGFVDRSRGEVHLNGVTPEALTDLRWQWARLWHEGDELPLPTAAGFRWTPAARAPVRGVRARDGGSVLEIHPEDHSPEGGFAPGRWSGSLRVLGVRPTHGRWISNLVLPPVSWMEG